MDFIQVIIFIVIIAVAIVQQIKKASKTEKVTSPKEVLADMFPPIEREGMSAPPVSPIRKPESARKQIQPASVPKQSVHTQRPVQKKAESSPIKLSTKEEARRAFIYSEIFNRKY